VICEQPETSARVWTFFTFFSQSQGVSDSLLIPAWMHWQRRIQKRTCVASGGCTKLHTQAQIWRRRMHSILFSCLSAVTSRLLSLLVLGALASFLVDMRPLVSLSLSLSLCVCVCVCVRVCAHACRVLKNFDGATSGREELARRLPQRQLYSAGMRNLKRRNVRAGGGRSDGPRELRTNPTPAANKSVPESM